MSSVTPRTASRWHAPTRRSTLRVAVAALLLSAGPAFAAGGDFSQDFTAAAPFTYDHLTGGGAYDDRTVGKSGDIVESLEGGDFTCDDIVTFLTMVDVADVPATPGAQTIELDYAFTAHSTGQQGKALGDIVGVAINYGPVSGGDGPGGTDSGIVDDGGSTATLVSESLTGPIFVKGSLLLGTVRIDDLEAAERTVLRVDVRIFCQPDANSTGNMQAQFAGARVVAPVQETIPGGAQTIPFKKVDQIAPILIPNIAILKEVSVNGGTTWFDANDAASAPTTAVGSGALYRLTVTNTGDTDLVNVTINDATLGIVNYVLGDLDFGQTAVLTSGQIPQLNQPDRCQAPGTVDNLADVVGEEPIGGQQVFDDDPALLHCVDVTILKEADRELSKIGDTIGYTFTLFAEGPAEAPDLVCTATDSLTGVIFDGTLDPGGAQVVVNEDFLVPGGAADPLVNTVTLDCTIGATGNAVNDEASESVNLFQPAIDIAKAADSAISKIGDTVDYTFTLSNNSSADTPALNCTATDSLTGEVFSGVLPLGTTVVNAAYPVPGGAPDPLTNTVTLNCTVAGFGNALSDSASDSVDLFQAAIDVAKAADSAVSKVGDTVMYTFTLSNNSSPGTPALDCTATDSLVGLVFDGVLPAGNTVVNKAYLVPPGAPDPLTNTVTLDCTVDGFGNTLSDSASDSVDLFQAAIDIAKAADGDISKVGDTVNYTFTLSNNSSPGTPALSCTATDSLVGVVFNGVLPPGNTVVNKAYLVPPGAPDPLTNTVTLDCSIAGFPNQLGDSAGHSIDLIHPSIALGKTCFPDPAVVGGIINWEVTAENTGDAGLECLVNDPTAGIVDAPLSLAPGASDSIAASRAAQPGDVPLLSNTASISCTLSGGALPNVITAPDATADCEVKAEAAGVLIIDEDGIDNGLLYWLGSVADPGPNNGIQFRKREVNDDKPGIGQRDVLRFFQTNVGNSYQLQTGQVGDEGWFAPQFIPSSWNAYDPGGDGLRAYVNGLVPQSLLDKVPDVTPLRATGLVGLEGGDYCAIVYDSDVSTNYGPLNGNLQGETLGIAAFHVHIDGVRLLDGFSSSTLPSVLLTVLDAAATCGGPLKLVDAPKPPSSSEPFDIDPENPTGGYLP